MAVTEDEGEEGGGILAGGYRVMLTSNKPHQMIDLLQVHLKSSQQLGQLHLH